MPQADYLPFDAAEIPIGKRFSIGGQQYLYEITKNETHGYFILAIKNAEGEVLYTTRVNYDNDLLHAIVTLGISRLLKAYDFTGENQTVTFENLGNPVKIYALEIS